MGILEKYYFMLRFGDVGIEGIENLLAHATEFDKTFFGPTPGKLFHMNSDTQKDDEKLNDMDNADLVRDFTEVKEALFSVTQKSLWM